MNNKYEFTGVNIDFWGKKLFQIRAKRSFWSVNKWDLGGYIEKEKNLSASDNSWVFGNARVYDNARAFGDAWVSGNAWVSDNAWVYSNADARINDNAWLLAKNNYSKWSFNSITIELTPEQIKKVKELLE